MLDDRVAAAAQPKGPPLTSAGRREATTPTDRKDGAPQWPRAGADGTRGDRWRLARTRVRRLLRGDGAVCERGTGGRSAAPRTLLHRDFWLEALDEQHRYGSNLRAFHRAWKRAEGERAPFFRWLDHGEGRALELPECSQEQLRRARVEYCSPAERRRYELRFVAGCGRGAVAEYAESRAPAHTDERSKWIFVVDPAGHMYLGRKRKGRFHHSSFVAGAPVVAAGKVVIKTGRILAIEPHSGHFKPQLESLVALRAVLERNGVDVEAVAFVKPKKWAGEWPFPELADSVDLDDFASASDTEDVFDGLDALAVGGRGGADDDEQWSPASP